MEDNNKGRLEKDCSKFKLSKLENGVMNGSNYDAEKIKQAGGERWGMVYDKFPEFGYKTGKKSGFIDWAQSTLAVCPCPDSLTNEAKITELYNLYSEYRESKTQGQ